MVKYFAISGNTYPSNNIKEQNIERCFALFLYYHSKCSVKYFAKCIYILKIIFTLILSLLLANNCFAQENYSIGLQLNPIFHFSQASITGSGGKMQRFNVGTQVGLELNIPVFKNLVTTPFLKYYRQSQKIEQTDFLNYLDDESKTFASYSYANVDVGWLFKYNVLSNAKNSLFLNLGCAFSFGSQVAMSYGSHYVGTDNRTSSVSIGHKYTPDANRDPWLSTRTVKLLVGARTQTKIKRIGVFEYGFLFYIPAQQMPVYLYEQILGTQDKGEIYSSVLYKSRQYSMEASIVYHIFNLSNKGKMVHPKRYS